VKPVGADPDDINIVINRLAAVTAFPLLRRLVRHDLSVVQPGRVPTAAITETYSSVARPLGDADVVHVRRACRRRESDSGSATVWLQDRPTLLLRQGEQFTKLSFGQHLRVLRPPDATGATVDKK